MQSHLRQPLAALISGLFLTTLAACGGSGGSADGTATAASVQLATTDATADAVDATSASTDATTTDEQRTAEADAFRRRTSNNNSKSTSTTTTTTASTSTGSTATTGTTTTTGSTTTDPTVTTGSTTTTAVPPPATTTTTTPATTTGTTTTTTAPTTTTTTTTATAASSTTDPCETLPAMPTLPVTYKTLTSFCTAGLCAKPDDGIDDTAAIQAAMDQSAPNTWLVFPAGKYQISSSLRIKTTGLTLWGAGATIHGTNTDDMSMVIEANNVSLYNFTLTAVTDYRRSRAEDTKIAIYGPDSVNPIVKNTIIRGNKIVPAGAAGTNLANSASSAGILVYRADGFLIAENTVNRTLADGIHMTQGAKNGRVLNNTVTENGDDMIAIVSYAYNGDPGSSSASDMNSGLAAGIASALDTNILVANNTVGAQYWGRGISVVGGSNITIRGNTLSNLPYGAGILLSREVQSGTYGVSNVLVEKNKLSDVQNLMPTYNFNNTFNANARTGHGAVELQSWMFADEQSYPALVDAFAVKNIAIRNNTVTRSAVPATRMGVGTGTTWTQGNRTVNGTGTFANVGVDTNVFSSIATSPAIQILSASSVVECTGNTVDGGAYSVATCLPKTAPVVTGATLTCTGT
jgi:parallel beta-helix repeat protein